MFMLPKQPKTSFQYEATAFKMYVMSFCFTQWITRTLLCAQGTACLLLLSSNACKEKHFHSIETH